MAADPHYVLCCGQAWTTSILRWDMSSNAIATDEQQDKPKNEFETAQSQSWRTSFAFSRRKDVVFLLPAITCSCIAGCLKPVNALIVGRFMNSFIKLASNTASHDELNKSNLDNLSFMLAIAAATWIVKAGSSMCWNAYGEAQSRTVRPDLFTSLLQRDLEWFDSQQAGIGAILLRLQSSVCPQFFLRS